MRTAVKQDLSRSAAAFNDTVWPMIRAWFGGGRIESVEDVTATGMAKDLDVLAGIDAWHVNGSVRGIASRIQWGEQSRVFPYNTFTVRMQRESGVETEYSKRLRAIDSSGGWLYPHITVQAYIDNHRNLLSVAACKTSDLICYIRDNIDTITMRRVVDRGNGSGASFAVVGFRELGNVCDVKSL